MSCTDVDQGIRDKGQDPRRPRVTLKKTSPALSSPHLPCPLLRLSVKLQGRPAPQLGPDTQRGSVAQGFREIIYFVSLVSEFPGGSPS